MDVNCVEFFKDISAVLNGTSPKSAGFYTYCLENLSKYVQNNFCGVYFLDSLGLSRKALFLGKREIKDDNCLFLESFTAPLFADGKNTFMQESSTVFNNNCPYLPGRFCAVSKLRIKNSFFGFFFFTSDVKYSKEQLEALEAMCSIYSYLIKDLELSTVFKFQLNALQDALAEKDEAHKVIEKQHKKLLELDKVRNQFLANISHELRTPLNAILGFSQALDARLFGGLNEKQAEYVQDIHTSGLHLLNMINELLDLAKIESKAMKLNLSEVCVKDAVEEVVGILSPLSGKKSITVTLENSLEPTDRKISADYQKFRQILYNLLSNAIKFTPDGGKIVIKTFAQKKDFVLEVEDNGVGIDPKNHKKIFTKYIHLNNFYGKNEPSTGLGLAITKELVRLHKGKITLKSEPNKGSTFIITLKGACL